MIAKDLFVATFGSTTPGDQDHLPGIVRYAIRNGYAIVMVAPGGKVPICTLTARQAKAADRQRQEELQAGGRAWRGARHECGIAHALTDVVAADRVVKRLIKERGSVNIGIEVGRSRMVHVDADTDEQVQAFISTWAGEEPERELSHLHPTVLTPGAVTVDSETGEETWRHKDGGHFWFTLPEGVSLADLPGRGSMRDEHGGWVASWHSHQALVPPSVRPEGAYVLAGEAGEAPQWLLERIRRASQVWAARRVQQASRAHFHDDPIDAWAASISWADLLESDGWTDTGKLDSCGCPIWTRPGGAAHYKSATAHQVGCAHYQIDEDRGGPLRLWTDDPPKYLATAVKNTGSATFSKLQYYAWRHHAGNIGSAMAELELAFLGGEDRDVVEQLSAMLDSLAGGFVGEHGPPTGPSGPPPAGPGAGSQPQGEPEPGPDPDREPDREPDPKRADDGDGDDDGGGPDLFITEEMAAYRTELLANRRLLMELDRQHIRERANTIRHEIQGHADRVKARSRHADAIDQVSNLPEEPEDQPWRIRRLWMQGQIVMVAAKFKVGKTTLVLNVVRSLVDGKPFLDQFETEPITGNLLIVNAEMTRRQFRTWIRDAAIDNRDKVFVLHAREAGLSASDIVTPAYRDLLVETLNRHEIQALVLDPLNPMLAASGIEENASSEVARWFNALADVIARTGVQEVLLVHHFGHVGDRGRGSSKFMDAPDALWTYTLGDAPAAVGAAKGDTDDADAELPDDAMADIEAALAAVPRYLSATGRDVDLPRSRVVYDKDTRLLSMPVVGDNEAKEKRARTRADKADRIAELRKKIIDVVRANPGIRTEKLKKTVKGNAAECLVALQAAIEAGEIVRTVEGSNNAQTKIHSFTVGPQ